jgi:hypothetical protein
MDKELREKILNSFVQYCKFSDHCKHCNNQDHIDCYGEQTDLIDQIYREHYAAITPEGLKLTKKEIHIIELSVLMSLSEACRRIAKAQLAKARLYFEADKQKAIEEAVAAKSIIYARAGDMAIKEAVRAERERIVKGIFDEIETHLKKYQWRNNFDDTMRHYPYCPTDFYALREKWQSLKSEEKPNSK